MQFVGWAYSDLTTTGPDPFASNATGNSSSPGASTITINPTATPTVLEVVDDDANFTDGDSGQRYQGPADFNGGSGFDVGDRIETEYSYIVRPQGSTDPADNITIYMLEIDADGQGIASDARLEPGVIYDIIAVDANDPVVPYSSLFVCLASGTRIATPKGDRAIDTLNAGDLVLTLDRGPQPILWAGQRKLTFPESPPRQKPVLIGRGRLGAGLPRRDLILSPQHRLLVFHGESRQALVKSRKLSELPGIRGMPGRRRVTYHTVLLPRHEIIFAEGAAVETFYPGPVGLGMLTAQERSALFKAVPALATSGLLAYGPPARPILRQLPVDFRLTAQGHVPFEVLREAG